MFAIVDSEGIFGNTCQVDSENDGPFDRALTVELHRKLKLKIWWQRLV